MLFRSFSKTEAKHKCSVRFSLFNTLVNACYNPPGSRLKVLFPFMALMNCLKEQWLRMIPSLIRRRVVLFLMYFGMTLGGLEEMDVTGSVFLGGVFLIRKQVHLPCVLPLPGFY